MSGPDSLAERYRAAMQAFEQLERAAGDVLRAAKAQNGGAFYLLSPEALEGLRKALGEPQGPEGPPSTAREGRS